MPPGGKEGTSMKKPVSVLLVCAMLCGLLTGCLYEDVSTSVHADGSGTIKMVVGISKEAMEQLSEEGSDGVLTLPTGEDAEDCEFFEVTARPTTARRRRTASPRLRNSTPCLPTSPRTAPPRWARRAAAWTT